MCIAPKIKPAVYGDAGETRGLPVTTYDCLPRKIGLLTAVLAAFLLAGCMQPHPKPVVKNSPYRLAIKKDLVDNWLDDYRKMADGDAKKDRRNQIINEFLWLADDAYYQWEPKFYSSGATLATLFDFTSLGLTGGTTVANSPKVLGAMATGVQGAQGSISKNFYDQQSRSVIVQKMRQMREAALVRIESGEKKSSTEYSLDQALVDVQNYYYAGTVTAALQGLATSTAEKLTEDKKDLDKARKGETPTQTIR
jgi:hypothetical protein